MCSVYKGVSQATAVCFELREGGCISILIMRSFYVSRHNFCFIYTGKIMLAYLQSGPHTTHPILRYVYSYKLKLTTYIDISRYTSLRKITITIT